jgi:hypothetical protein
MAPRSIVALVAAVILADCVRAPAPDRFFSRSELSSLVTDRTLYVPSCCNRPDGTLVYLAKDGTGWLDSRLMPGDPPKPGGMSVVLAWRVDDGSQVCLWATPLIGDMPSFVPAFSECLQVLRSLVPPDGLVATVAQGGKFHTSWLGLYPFNAFPQPVIDQYLTQVRVLYGGHVPAWTVAEPVEAAQ